MAHKIFQQTVLFVVLIAHSFAIVASDNPFLRAPVPVNFEEFEKDLSAKTFKFRWWAGKASAIDGPWALAFEYLDGKTTVMFEYIDTDLEGNRCSCRKTSDGTTDWSVTMGNINSPLEVLLEEHEARWMATPRLVAPDNTPQTISIDALATCLDGKRVLFYTGAGISAGIVPMMAEIEAKLELKGTGKKLWEEEHFADPKRLIKLMASFFRVCLLGKPTVAHNALADLLCLKNWGLITENIDQLHQRSGIMPHAASEIQDESFKSRLSALDIIVTVGLKSDELTLLAEFKKRNKNGIIVAINLEKTDYLSSNDYFVPADAQEAIPALLEELRQINR